MLNNKNTLYKDKYLISRELHKALEEERLSVSPSLRMPKTVSKNLGIYLIAVRLLNKEKGTIIYNYVYYPNIFLETFLTYVLTRNNIKSLEWGDMFYIIDKNIIDNNPSASYQIDTSSPGVCKHASQNSDYSRLVFSDLSDLKQYFDFIKSSLNLSLDSSNSITTNLINLINNLTYVTFNMDEVINIINLSVKKDYKNYIQTILNPFVKDKFFHLDDIDNNQDINLLNSKLFIVNDINAFRKEAKKNGYDISEGPQKWRGQINSMSELLSSIDSDYRNSLYYHNNFHVRFGQVDIKYALPKSKFSFRNIHMNLGNVRWYSCCYAS